ncbi:MAG: 16S rRNA (guanine(527)-N(7))-methyltransferase RsmG [Bordetella sp.]|nr:MAG: 16S rRNA (guanine(527)-N(7))-methyltransferase RsmG [Bordetella sp.]
MSSSKTILDVKFEHYLEIGSSKLSLFLSQTQKKNLSKYFLEIQKWNKVFRLISDYDEKRILVRHFFDSLSIIHPIDNRLKSIQGKGIFCDVGSGNGFPGIVLAIMRPYYQITCVDSKEKKTAFLTHLKSLLNLKNLVVKNERIETLKCLECDIVISRAFSSLSNFVNMAGRHIHKRGLLVAMKGKFPKFEIRDLYNSKWKVECSEPLVVPDLNASRFLLWIKPIHCEKKFF